MQENFIRRVPIFSTLPHPHLQLIAGAFEQRRYAAGDMILVQGTIPAGLYILLQGQAVWLQTALDGRVTQLGAMLVGHYIHDEALFQDKAVDTASLQALTTTTMLVLSRKSMTSLINKYPELQSALGIKATPTAPVMPKPRPPKKKDGKTEADIVNVGSFTPFVSILKTAGGSMIFRKHWTVWFARVAFPAFVAIMALGAMFGLVFGNPLEELASFAWGASGIFLFLSLLWIYLADWGWHNDFILLSDSHLTLVERRPFWQSPYQEIIALQSIQEVQLLAPSVWQQMMGFGDLEIAFYGQEEPVYLEQMAMPLVVKNEIDTRQQALMRRGATDAAKREADVIRQFRSQFDNIKPNAPAPLPYDTFDEAPRPSPFGQPRPKTGEIQPPDIHLPPNPVVPPKTTGNRPPKFPQKRKS